VAVGQSGGLVAASRPLKGFDEPTDQPASSHS
jgi:hypothetical protein